MRPFSQACENNKRPILSILQQYLTDACTLLEIGSGTGQHAVFFAEHLPHVQWQPTDLGVALSGMRMWFESSSSNNLLPPLALDVRETDWPVVEMSCAFTANTIHIMDEIAVTQLFVGVGARLLPGGLFFTYGPFIYQGQYTSPSNQEFDRWLKARDPSSGIKSVEVLKAQAKEVGLRLLADHDMPANNQLLVWQKIEREING